MQQLQHPTNTVILECFKVGEYGSGSEEGTARAWLEALININSIKKIHLLTSSVPISLAEKCPEKIEIHIIPKNTKTSKLAYKTADSLLGKGNKWSELIFKISIVDWLIRSSKKAKEIAKNEKITLAIHGSYSSQLPGTNLPKIKKINPSTTVLCHGNAQDKKTWKIIHLNKNWKPDIITTPKEEESVKNNWVWLRDPFFPPDIEKYNNIKRKEEILYIDHLSPRKGASVLIEEMLEIKKEGGEIPPITILTDIPNRWKKFYPKVKTIPKVKKEEYLKTLAEYKYLLNTSVREGSCTSAMETLLLGNIVITSKNTNITGKDTELKSIIKRNKRIDEAWNEIQKRGSGSGMGIKMEIDNTTRNNLINTMGVNPAIKLIKNILDKKI